MKEFSKELGVITLNKLMKRNFIRRQKIKLWIIILQFFSLTSVLKKIKFYCIYTRLDLCPVSPMRGGEDWRGRKGGYDPI